jgi:NifU-like protein involved in Fe-S cluster formation
MNSDPYSTEVRALFANPVHAGALSASHRVDVQDQGIRVALSATLDGGMIECLRFRAFGCPHVIAAAEWVCFKLQGTPAADLARFSVAELMQSLAVPTEKSGRILVIEDAVRALGAAISKSSDIIGQD